MNIMLRILKVIHYFWLIFSKVLEKMSLKIYHLDPAKFFSHHELAWEAALKKAEVKLKILTYINMLLMAEKDIRSTMSCESSTCKS